MTAMTMMGFTGSRGNQWPGAQKAAQFLWDLQR